LAVLVTAGWAWATWRSFTSNIVRVDAIPSTRTSASASEAHRPLATSAQNILIVGNDDRDSASDAELALLRTTRDGGSYNTDTMMVLHVPADGSRATVISIPRDSYVAIPGHPMNKINQAYPDGMNASDGNKSIGAQVAVMTVQDLTGLHIDHFVQVDLIGFYRIATAIGGVPVDLCAPTRDPNSGADFRAGPQLITGSDALSFVRQRDGFPNGLGDLDRIKRQQYFLSSAFRTMSSSGVLLNPVKLQKLLHAVSSSLSVDRTLDLLTLAEQLQSLTSGNLYFATIPWDGFADELINGIEQSTVVVHPAAVQAYVAQLLRLDTPHPTASAPAPLGRPVPGTPATGPATTTHAAASAATPPGVSTAAQNGASCIY
jgi:LCP family protein required for cell wall assembly